MNGGSPTIFSEEVVQSSKSNLTVAFSLLPKNRREDMMLFYTFCRMMDDLADEASLGTPEGRIEQLKIWRSGLEKGFTHPTDFQKQIVALVAQYSIPVEYLLNVIDGCLSDLEETHIFQTYGNLQKYMYQVSCSVGLASLHIFGNRDKNADSYALQLGYALQLTNIIRDVREDVEQGRIYIPGDMIQENGYSADALGAYTYNDRFCSVMNRLAQKAQGHFARALFVKKSLSRTEQQALRTAEMMREIYQGILHRMQRDGFRVFDRRYGLPKWQKICIVMGAHLERIVSG